MDKCKGNCVVRLDGKAYDIAIWAGNNIVICGGYFELLETVGIPRVLCILIYTFLANPIPSDDSSLVTGHSTSVCRVPGPMSFESIISEYRAGRISASDVAGLVGHLYPESGGSRISEMLNPAIISAMISHGRCEGKTLVDAVRATLTTPTVAGREVAVLLRTRTSKERLLAAFGAIGINDIANSSDAMDMIISVYHLGLIDIVKTAPKAYAVSCELAEERWERCRFNLNRMLNMSADWLIAHDNTFPKPADFPGLVRWLICWHKHARRWVELKKAAIDHHLLRDARREALQRAANEHIAIIHRIDRPDVSDRVIQFVCGRSGKSMWPYTRDVSVRTRSRQLSGSVFHSIESR